MIIHVHTNMLIYTLVDLTHYNYVPFPSLSAGTEVLTAFGINETSIARFCFFECQNI